MFNTFLSVFSSFILPVLSGYFAVSLTDRELELRFRMLLAVPMGFGIHSLFYFVSQCLGMYNFSNYKLFEFIILCILAILYYNQERPDFSKHKYQRLNNWFYVLNIYGLSMFLKYYLINPMGSWDGFRIWNTKAVFLSLQTPQWKQMFVLPHYMAHGDYPLFLPSSTARIWQYFGGENYFCNITLGLIFTFTIVYLLFQAVRYFKSEKVAYIVCSVLTLADIFMVNGASQSADIPLAMYFLSSIVCLFFFFKTKRLSSLVLSIVFAGLSVWVKNEGMMFLLVYGGVMGMYFLTQKDWKKLSVLIFGVLPFAVFSIWFKKFSNVPNDIIMSVMLTKSSQFLFDGHRYLVIFKTFITMMLKKFTVFLALFILCTKGFKLREKIKMPIILSFAIFILMAAGYIFVYAITPHDINWLAENSMDRIILQILPVFLLIFSTTLRIGKPDTLN